MALGCQAEQVQRFCSLLLAACEIDRTVVRSAAAAQRPRGLLDYLVFPEALVHLVNGIKISHIQMRCFVASATRLPVLSARKTAPPRIRSGHPRQVPYAK